MSNAYADAHKEKVEGDAKEILRALLTLTVKGGVYELRAKGVRDGKFESTWSGYFDDPEAMTKAALEADAAQPEAVWFSINPVNPDLLARSANKVDKRAKTSAGDDDTLHRRWLFIDFDPNRVSGVSATDAEKALALAAAKKARDWLSSMRWPLPVLADSGNGYHLLYSISEPSTPESLELITGCLNALQAEVGNPKNATSDGGVAVDSTVANASRMCKLYGTVARKGSSIPARPHRLSRVLEVPAALREVNHELLSALALNAPVQGSSRKPKPGRSAHTDGFDVEAYATKAALTIVKTEAYKGGFMFTLDRCPFNANHSNKDCSALFTNADGVPGFKCHHDGCKNNGIRELFALHKPEREKAEPGPSLHDRAADALKIINDTIARAATDPLGIGLFSQPAFVDAAATILQYQPVMYNGLMNTRLKNLGVGIKTWDRLVRSHKIVRDAQRKTDAKGGPVRQGADYPTLKAEIEDRFVIIEKDDLVYEFKDRVGRKANVTHTPKAFTTLTASHFHYLDAEGKRQSAAQQWLQDENAHRAHALRTMPGQPHEHDGDINRWHGFAVDERPPQPGELWWWKALLIQNSFDGPQLRWDPNTRQAVDTPAERERLRQQDANWDTAEYARNKWFLEQLCAWPFANPTKYKMDIGTIIANRHGGIGKNTLVETLGLLLGNDMFTSMDAMGASAGWTGEFGGVMLVMIEETEVGDKSAITTLLKTMVTAKNPSLNTKYGKKEKAEMTGNIFILSNEVIEPIRIQRIEERRWFVLMPTSLPITRTDAERIYEAREKSLPALLWHLRYDVNFGGFSRHHAITTKAFHKLLVTGESNVEDWVRAALARPESFRGRKVAEISEIYQSADAYDPEFKRHHAAIKRAFVRTFQADGDLGVVSTAKGAKRLFAIEPGWAFKSRIEQAAEFDRAYLITSDEVTAAINGTAPAGADGSIMGRIQPEPGGLLSEVEERAPTGGFDDGPSGNAPVQPGEGVKTTHVEPGDTALQLRSMEPGDAPQKRKF